MGRISLSLLLALLATATRARRLHATSGASTYDVIVIGAGVAGLTAAQQLEQAGVSVLVLEARKRSGGRLESVATKHGRVDLGAMWIHGGQPGNQLYDLVTGPAMGLSVSPRQDYTSVSTFRPDGSPASRSTALSILGPWRRGVTERINSLRANESAPDVSLAEVYAAYLRDNPAFSSDQRQQSNLMAHVSFQTLLNANLTQLSARRYGDAKTIPAVDVMVAGGFDALTDKMAASLHSTPMLLNTVVKRISQTADSVTVTTADGTQLTASYALLTPSLGVLKSGAISFAPPLPADKQRAIQEMGMGLLNKLILVFDAPFWSDTDFISRFATDLSGRWCTFLNLHRLWGVPVLVALTPADTARALEQLSDAEVVGQAIGVLRTMYENVPEPVESYVTRWGADEFALGSYSYFATGNALNITGMLAEPVGRIMFGGEHTSPKPATVLGGYLSGLREAQRLAGLLGKAQSAPA